MVEPMRHLVAVATILALSACSKHRDDAPAPLHTAPWRASPVTSGAPHASDVVAYAIESRGSARFELKAHDATPRGELRVARGELSVDLMDLAKTRGHVEMDLGSVAIDAEGDGGRDVQQSQVAQDWLDVGQDRPEAARERVRWARFTIRSVDHASADAADRGHVVKRGSLPALGDTEDAGDAGNQAREVRSVDLIANGDLELHGFRVERSLKLRALFEYAAPAVAGARPQRIVIQTRSPFVVSLQVHDIKPRDAKGVFVAEGMKLLGSKIGKDARVSLELAAVPKMR